MNISNTIRLGLVLLTLTSCCWSAMAQDRTPRGAALHHLQTKYAQYGLQASDVANLQLTDEYTSDNNGVTHVWLQQGHLGIPVFNALFGLHVLPSGEIVTTDHRFVDSLASKVNSTKPSLSAPQALTLAMRHLGFSDVEMPALRTKTNAQKWIFEGGSVSKSDIPVSACYMPMPDGSVRLAWMIVIDQVGESDIWSMRVDAQTGEILHKNNRTLYCNPNDMHHQHSASCANISTLQKIAEPTVNTTESNVLNGSYRVYALPTESPNHGPRTLVTNPASTQFSPFGWHDINGAAGAEYTYTRGNNAWAYTDTGSDNTGSEPESAAGGSSLSFDFPLDPNAEPEVNRNASVTNLFYMTNMMHDISAKYGFTEAAGNFQTLNYSDTGEGDDPVRAEAIDGGGTDNASFSTSPDGSPARMQMYKWSRSGGQVVQVNAPSQVEGVYFGQASGSWGATITGVAVSGDAVVAVDGTNEPDLVCEAPIVNVNGKIAIVERGICPYSQKALNVQQAGAKACIICNYDDNTAPMLPGAFGDQVTIPVVMMSQIDCQTLKQFAGQGGLNISLVQPPGVGPNFLDGDYDNGIIAHEYAHGISIRLTGGPSQTDCLDNAEQMGEGWSDFFALALTARTGDLPEQNQGIGTYVRRQATDGVGIRRYPYTTDMNVSPLTYGKLAENTRVHAVGEVWANMLWDLYWAMVDKYGFDANLNNTNSGNGRAIQLVMDGLKLQPCSPGFKDGMLAIMQADRINYGGADTCLISQVFARRGLGINAIQGLTSSAGDQVEDFEPIATCIKALKIRKETTSPLINPGQTATWKIIVTNHKDETVTNVVVTDQIPDSLQFVSASFGGTLQGNTVTWNVGEIPPGQIRILTLNAKSISAGSPSLYRDQMDDQADWMPSVLLQTYPDFKFELQSGVVKVGNSAWFASNEDVKTDIALTKQTEILVDGNNPVLRFWTQFQTQAGSDAGFLEFQKAGETTWQRISTEETFRGGYTGGIKYSTFAIPFLSGFSGTANTWRQCYADLSQFAGETIKIRFRFGTDQSIGGVGWYVDEVEMIDMINFDTEACLTSAQGDQACDRAPQRGVILNPGEKVSTDEPTVLTSSLYVHPNPASNILYVTSTQPIKGQSRLSLISADGRVVRTQEVGQINAYQPLQLQVQDIPAGMYIVRVASENTISVARVVIRH
jgi:extracellular elastinolytic metalloproteinase